MKNLLKNDVIHDIPLKQPWRLRFWSVFLGQAISLVGSSLTQFILIWWVTETTRSVTYVSMAGIAGLLPQALLGPLGGVFADRFSRRLIMIVADIISGMCMLVLVCLFHFRIIELWHIYICMVIRSSASAFQQPAAMASTPMLVPESFIFQANGLNQVMAGILVVCGAPLGALLMGFMQLKWALSIDVVTMLVGLIPLMIFHIPQDFSNSIKGGITLQLRDGINTIWTNKGLRHIFILFSISTIAVIPLINLLPLLVKEHFMGNAVQLAYFESFAGAGMIIGGIAMIVARPKNRVQWILFSFITASLATAAAAVVSPDMLWLGVVFWTIANIALVVGDAVFTTLLQMIVPNHLQGRVLSLLNTLLSSAAPLGLLLATPIGEVIGVRSLFIISGNIAAFVLLLGFLSGPVRSLDN